MEVKEQHQGSGKVIQGKEGSRQEGSVSLLPGEGIKDTSELSNMDRKGSGTFLYQFLRVIDRGLFSRMIISWYLGMAV